MYDPSTLRLGDILLMARRPAERPWTPGAVLGDLIRYAEVNPLQHAAMVCHDTKGNLVIVEALWHVTMSPLDKYAGNGWRFTVPGAALEQKTAAAAFMAQRIGRVYGVEELLRDAERDLLHIPVWPRVEPRYFTCSGLVAAGWAAADYPLTFAPWPSPADLSYSPLLVGIRPWQVRHGWDGHRVRPPLLVLRRPHRRMTPGDV